MDLITPPDNTNKVYDSILETIGWTPMVRLHHVVEGVRCPVYAKLELFNPGGSVKDRIGIRMIEAYERSGVLNPGGTVVEATSGNTGVGLALVCAIKGYRAVFVMPDKMSQEKIQLLRAYGAEVIVTPTAVAPDDPRSYYSVAKKIVKETPNAVLGNQYHNPVNPETHYRTTGPEILKQTYGKVTDVVIGMGTGGTISGVAKYVKDHAPEVRIIGVDPIGSILKDAWERGGSTEGLEARTYKIEGIGEDFIPSTLDLDLIDEVVQVGDAESFQWARKITREEGIFCGGSSGSAFAGLMKIAADLDESRFAVVIFPDSGSRYLSTLFDDDWMRQHGFLSLSWERAQITDLLDAKGSAKIVLAHPDDPLQDVISRMRENGISQIPVVDEDQTLLGTVNETAMLTYMLHSKEHTQESKTISSVIDPSVSTCLPTDSIQAIINKITDDKFVIVVNENHIPIDIITVIDLLDYVGAQGQE